MDIILWLAFVAASLVISVTPGPGVVSIVGYAISSGRRTALASVAGMALGNAIAISLSLAGVGALLAASALAFNILKYAGAAYLVGLGIYAIVTSRKAVAAGRPSAAVTPRLAFVGNVLVGTFHPKTLIFFAAFAPQFISADAPYLGQAAILAITFTGVAALTDTLYALLAARGAQLLRTPAASLWLTRTGGGALILAGVATAAARR